MSYLRLLRPPLLLLGGLASIAVVSMCGQLHSLHAQLAIIIAFLINSAFNVYNEICDVETDKILKPYKAIPSGSVSVETATEIFHHTLMAVFLILIFFSLLTRDIYTVLIAVMGLLFSYLYDKYGKTSGVLGNFILMMPYTLAILFLLQTCGSVERYWTFAVGFGATTFAFNICTLYQDTHGDAKAGLYTASMQLGRVSSIFGVVSSQLANILIVTAPIPPYSKAVFILTNHIVTGSSLLLVYPPESMIVQRGVEWLCRIAGRSLLILGFVLMVLNL